MADNPIILYRNALALGDQRPIPDVQVDLAGTTDYQAGTGPLVFSRQTVKHVIDPDTGLLTSVPANTVGYERGIDGVARALIEESSTNLITYSEQFDQSSWTKSECTVTPDAALAPDGTTTMDKIIATAVFGNHYVYETSGVRTASTAYSFSFFAKAAEIYYIRPVFTADLTGVTLSALVNLSTGEVTDVSAGFTVTVKDVGNSIWRVSCSAMGDGNTTAFSTIILLTNSAGVAQHTGDGSSGVYVWGAQLEARPRATSYIQTTGAAVTRNADIAYLPNANIPSPANGATIVVDAAIPNDGRTHYVVNVGIGLCLRRDVGGTLLVRIFDVIIIPTTIPDELPHTFALRTDGTTHEVLMDGVVIGSATGALRRPTAAMFIGSQGGGTLIDSFIGGIRIYNRALTDAELTADSAGYYITDGIEQSGTTMDEAWTWDCLRNSIITTDNAGAISTVHRVRGSTPTHLVLGAHRHDSAGFKPNMGDMAVDAYTATGWTQIGTTDLTATLENEPALVALSAHTPVYIAGHYLYRLRLTGQRAFNDVAYPELYLGDALHLPFITPPFDPEEEEWTGPSSTAETGRVYEASISRRYVARPSFKYIDPALGVEINVFREAHVEERNPFWWFYAPETAPRVGYMMRHAGKSAPMPIGEAGWRSLRLQMIEAV